jgi:hypothetical protein
MAGGLRHPPYILIFKLFFGLSGQSQKKDSLRNGTRS